MTITMEMTFPATREQYDAIKEKMGVGDNAPDGLLIHVASQDGENLKSIDVWESEDAFNKFNEGTLMPAIMDVMGPPPEGAPAPAAPTITEVFDVLKP